MVGGGGPTREGCAGPWSVLDGGRRSDTPFPLRLPTAASTHRLPAVMERDAPEPVGMERMNRIRQTPRDEKSPSETGPSRPKRCVTFC